MNCGKTVLRTVGEPEVYRGKTSVLLKPCYFALHEANCIFAESGIGDSWASAGLGVSAVEHVYRQARVWCELLAACRFACIARW